MMIIGCCEIRSEIWQIQCEIASSARRESTKLRQLFCIRIKHLTNLIEILQIQSEIAPSTSTRHRLTKVRQIFWIKIWQIRCEFLTNPMWNCTFCQAWGESRRRQCHRPRPALQFQHSRYISKRGGRDIFEIHPFLGGQPSFSKSVLVDKNLCF